MEGTLQEKLFKNKESGWKSIFKYSKNRKGFC